MPSLTRPRRAKHNDPLDLAFKRLEEMLPTKCGPVLRWMQRPGTSYFRVTLGIFMVILSAFSFLPVIGLEFLPIGLLLMAQEIPGLRKPVGKGVLVMLDWADRAIQKGKDLRAQVAGSRS